MSTFEYMSVMHSILLALGIARVLGGIADVVRDWRRLEAKWFFLGWLALLLAMHVGWWFGLWAMFSTISEISIVSFFSWFLIPASLYVASRLLIPEFQDGSVSNLAERFDQVRIPFFTCFIVAVVPVLPGLVNAPQSQVLLPIFGALAITGIFVTSRRGHVALLYTMLFTYLTFLALARTSLGQ